MQKQVVNPTRKVYVDEDGRRYILVKAAPVTLRSGRVIFPGSDIAKKIYID